MKYLLLLTLGTIWGSAFILIKKCTLILNVVEIASLRILLPTLLFIPIFLKYLNVLSSKQKLYCLIIGLTNNLIPYLLYAYSEIKIESYLAGFLTSLTPLFTVIIGFLFFKLKINRKIILGLIIATVGSSFLLNVNSFNFFNPYTFSIVLATIFYGISTNMIKAHFTDINPIIATAHIFVYTAIPALILYYLFYESNILVFTSYWPIYLLGFLVTGIASIIFFHLTQTAGPTFSSLVLYLVPIVGLFFGIIYQESVDVWHVLGSIIILFSIYIISDS